MCVLWGCQPRQCLGHQTLPAPLSCRVPYSHSQPALLPQDDAVPVAVGQQLFEQLGARDMALTLVKDGDHRLARPQDIGLLLHTVDTLVERLLLLE